jgi:hypothetical protein
MSDVDSAYQQGYDRGFALGQHWKSTNDFASLFRNMVILKRDKETDIVLEIDTINVANEGAIVVVVKGE